MNKNYKVVSESDKPKKPTYLRDKSGNIINPEAARKAAYVEKLQSGKRKKKHKTNKDKYFGRKLVRICPNCYSKEIEKLIHYTNAEDGTHGKQIKRVFFKCKKCGSLYVSRNLIKVFKAPGEGVAGQKKMTCKEFKEKIERESVQR